MGLSFYQEKQILRAYYLDCTSAISLQIDLGITLLIDSKTGRFSIAGHYPGISRIG